MNNIKIGNNKIRLAINEDENRIIEFDPNDVMFINRYYSMMAGFELKQKEFIDKAAEIDKITTFNSFGVKMSDIEGIKLTLEMCDYMKEQIDYVFGNGTSEKVFENAINPRMIEEFLSGISEYISSVRNVKIERYLGEDGVKGVSN